jgi:hypothetical protein
MWDMNRIKFGNTQPICKYNRGIITIRRRDADSEAILDQQFEKIGHLRWRIKVAFDRQRKPTTKHKRAYIIGKGRSADYLQESDLQDGMVLCCNEAVLIAEKVAPDINEVYGVRQDYAGGIRMRPEKASMIITDVLVPLYYDDPKAILINPCRYVKDSGPTMDLCIAIARLSGACEIIMYGFDSIKHNDLRYCSVANDNNKKTDNSHLFRHKKPEGLIWRDPESYVMEP